MDIPTINKVLKTMIVQLKVVFDIFVKTNTEAVL
ncbi:hypothetical protein J2Y03_005292 [Neobacillus niacini]|nr:hypothetical protein [Neobacillus niacini]